MKRDSLAVQYRPLTFDDVIEQDTTKKILQQQIKTGTFKSAYLFCGSAGTGKTTCARIFAKEINKKADTAIELDAASHNGIDDVREIIQQSQTQNIVADYKIFIIDECHALSNSAWQAMLKLIEEPPAKTLFIFCTTDSQKIPATILSRVQRFYFQKISKNGIYDRLIEIAKNEEINYDSDAIDKLAELANGCMRQGISLLDKCAAYTDDYITLDIVSSVCGIQSNYYDVMFELTDAIIFFPDKVLQILEKLHYEYGIDLKLFVKEYLQFVLDLNKYCLVDDFTYITIPDSYKKQMDEYRDTSQKMLNRLLDSLLDLYVEIQKVDMKFEYVVARLCILF